MDLKETILDIHYIERATILADATLRIMQDLNKNDLAFFEMLTNPTSDGKKSIQKTKEKMQSFLEELDKKPTENLTSQITSLLKKLENFENPTEEKIQIRHNQVVADCEEFLKSCEPFLKTISQENKALQLIKKTGGFKKVVQEALKYNQIQTKKLIRDEERAILETSKKRVTQLKSLLEKVEATESSVRKGLKEQHNALVGVCEMLLKDVLEENTEHRAIEVEAIKKVIAESLEYKKEAIAVFIEQREGDISPEEQQVTELEALLSMLEGLEVSSQEQKEEPQNARRNTCR